MVIFTRHKVMAKFAAVDWRRLLRLLSESRYAKDGQSAGPDLKMTDHIMTAGSVQSLIDAVRVAQVELLDWLVNDYGFDKWEGWQVLSQAGTMRVGNIVDPNLTVVAKFPKELLKNL